MQQEETGLFVTGEGMYVFAPYFSEIYNNLNRKMI